MIAFWQEKLTQLPLNIAKIFLYGFPAQQKGIEIFLCGHCSQKNLDCKIHVQGRKDQNNWSRLLAKRGKIL